MSKFIKINILSAVLTLVMFASWLFNMGWYRVVGSWLLIPIFHPLWLFFTNNIATVFISKNKIIKYPLIAVNITFLLPHLLIYDGGDMGEAYIFFHLIENNRIAAISTCFGIVALLLHIVAIITVIVLVIIQAFKKAKQ